MHMGLKDYKQSNLEFVDVGLHAGHLLLGRIVVSHHLSNTGKANDPKSARTRQLEDKRIENANPL